MVVDRFGKPVKNARIVVRGIRHDVTTGEHHGLRSGLWLLALWVQDSMGQGGQGGCRGLISLCLLCFSCLTVSVCPAVPEKARGPEVAGGSRLLPQAQLCVPEFTSQ